MKRVRPDKDMPEIPASWQEVEPLKEELEKAGFEQVESYEVETTMQFERLESLMDFLLQKLPHMQMLTKDMSEDDMGKLKELMVLEGRDMSSSEPGTLTGTALVAVGRK